jgi:hypothetical protein
VEQAATPTPTKHTLGSGTALCFKRGPDRGTRDVRYCPQLTTCCTAASADTTGEASDAKDVAAASSSFILSPQKRLWGVHKDAPMFLPLFAFPRGTTIDVKPADAILPADPQFMSFVLTNEHGAQTFGYCLTFEDRLCDRGVEALRRGDGGGALAAAADAADASTVLVTQKALCLLSRWPFTGFFKKCVLAACRARPVHAGAVCSVWRVLPSVPCGRFLLDLYCGVCSGVLSPEERVSYLLNSVPVPDALQRVNLLCFPGAVDHVPATSLWVAASALARARVLMRMCCMLSTVQSFLLLRTRLFGLACFASPRRKCRCCRWSPSCLPTTSRL